MAERLIKTEERGKEGLLQQKIVDLVGKIEDDKLLERIYRFVKYVYIHKTN